MKRWDCGRPTFSLSSLALPWVLAWVCLGATTPFWPVFSLDLIAARLNEAVNLSIERPYHSTVLERLATFLPIGLLIHWVLVTHRRRRAARRAITLVCLAVLLIELGQVVSLPRHARLSDVLLGAAAGIAGVFLSVRLGRCRLALQRCYLRHDRAVAVGLLLFGNIAIGTAVLVAHSGLDLSGWDRSYPLLLANEHSEDRPWRGCIRGFAIYPRALAASDVARLSRSAMMTTEGALRRELTPAVLYVFDACTGRRVEPQIGDQASLTLWLPEPGPATWLPTDAGLDVRGPTVFRSAAPARVVCDVIERSGAFTVELSVKISDLTLRGPARIVSVSWSPKLRNFTVGQHLDQIDFRVRTRRTGLNGSKVRFRSPYGHLEEGWHHLVATYDDGTVRLYIDGREAQSPAYLHSMGALLFRVSWPGSGVLAAVLLFAPLGILASAALWAYPRPKRVALGICVTVLGPLTVSMIACACQQRGQDLPFLAAAPLASALPAAAYRALARHKAASPA